MVTTTLNNEASMQTPEGVFSLSTNSPAHELTQQQESAIQLLDNQFINRYVEGEVNPYKRHDLESAIVKCVTRLVGGLRDSGALQGALQSMNDGINAETVQYGGQNFNRLWRQASGEHGTHQKIIYGEALDHLDAESTQATPQDYVHLYWGLKHARALPDIEELPNA